MTMYAASHGHADVNARDATGHTPLMMAARTGMDEAVRLLVSRGGFTALMAAAYNDRPEVIETLLRHGAAAELPDQAGKTALAWAREKECSTRTLSLLDAAGTGRLAVGGFRR